MNTDPLESAIADLWARVSAPNQPEALFRALDGALAHHVGHGLLTLLLRDGNEVERVYSSNPVVYPLAGRKPMGTTPWGDLVLQRQQPFLGRDPEAVRWAFFDHELIASLGLGSAINIPVVYHGATLGTINLLHREGFYTPAHVEVASRFAPVLIPALLQARHSHATDRTA